MKYKIRLHYDNIDNSLFTHEKADVIMDAEVTDERTAHILGEHLKKTLAADSYAILVDNLD